MKRLFILVSFVILLTNPSWALNTIISSSIYANSSDSLYPDISYPMVQPTINRVHFKNNMSNTHPELSNALTIASYIFSNAMEELDILLQPIEAEVSIGDVSDFDFDDEICKVNIVYTDTIEYHTYFSNLNQYYDYTYPILVPKAMSNQGKGTSFGPCMYISFRPDIRLHCDTTPTPADKYDAITILLRALAMGCGIQSTFDASTFSIGISENNTTYINAFDTQILNENNISLLSVLEGDLSLSSFLNGKKISANALTYHTHNIATPIRLYNGWENGVGPTLTHLTINSISDSAYSVSERANGFMDLMDYRIKEGVMIREVTPYTIALLEKLGWLYTLPVGPDPLSDLHNCSLSCPKILSPNTQYIVAPYYDNVWFENITCELNSMNNKYTIGTGIDLAQSFSYSSIPNNVQWERNPITKNIIGHIKADAVTSYQGGYMRETKMTEIEIPYRPNKPIVNKSETASAGKIHLSLRAFANGSDTYTVTYTGLTNNHSHSFTVSSYALDTVLQLPATQYYDIAIYGTNSEGNSNTFYFTAGSSVPHNLQLAVYNTSSTLWYDLSNHGQIDPDLIFVTSVKIYNAQGLLEKNILAKDWTAPINISSLSSGYHILTVVANGQTYSQMFHK